MTLKKKIKQVLNYLQAGYQAGVIGYPRVDNTYMKQAEGTDMFPHPSLPEGLSPILSPLKKRKSVAVNREDLILFLSTLQIVSPAQIEDTIGYLSHYLNDELTFYDQSKEDEALLALSIINRFMEEHSLDRKKIHALRQELYTKSFLANGSATLFSQEGIYFFPDDENKKADCASWKKMVSSRPSSDELEYGGIVHAPSLTDAFIFYDEEKKKKKEKKKIDAKDISKNTQEEETPSRKSLEEQLNSGDKYEVKR